MGLGNHLFHARKKKGLSKEEVAEKLGISRQTVSKWETDETLPDICQSKRLAVLSGLSLDELVEFDIDIKEIQEVIDRKLAVIDLTASIMCMENKMPMYVFGLNEENSIVKAVGGAFSGTKVTV